MDWNKAAEGFKFAVGNLVRYRTRDRSCAAIVVSRALEDDGGSEPHRVYLVMSDGLLERQRMCQKMNEFELEVAPERAGG